MAIFNSYVKLPEGTYFLQALACFWTIPPPLRVEFSTDLEIGHVCNREKSAKTVEQIENYEQHLNVHIFGLYILQLNI